MITEEQKKEFQEMNKSQLNVELRFAAADGNLDIVKYVLTSPDLKEHAYIHNDDSKALFWSCNGGHLEVVKYLLTSPELKEHANIHAKNYHALVNACAEGHLDIVRFLLTSPELKEHADIHAQNDKSLSIACANEKINIVKYLLTSPELKEHANIHADNDNIFIINCYEKNLMVGYFIFDYQIEKTETIEQYLIENNREDILHLFDKRGLEQKLQLDLNHHIKTDIKIKL